MRSSGETGRRALRRRAEARLRARPAAPRVEATADVLRLIHELEVHQIELELQNEELRRVRDELEASVTRYSELYDFAPVGYVTLDARSTILEINLVGSTLLGKDRAPLVGQRFAQWVTPATRPALDELLAILEHEERASCDVAITSAKGKVHLHIDAVPEAPARVAEWRCRAALTDVTEVKAAAKLRESDRRKSAFLAMLSHELRNPLGAIANATHLLERVPPGSEQAGRARSVIQRQTSQLTRLVNDLLDLTRIERGRMELKSEVVELRGMVRQTCEDYREMFEQRGVELHVIAPETPIAVSGDSARLTQIVGNLLHNAAKFTPPRGVVTVVVEKVAGGALLRVRDTGVGIPPEQFDKLFEPFAQAEQGLARTGGGLGLGLSLVKGIVEMHGGTVACRSDGLRCGAEFLVTLPLAPAAATSPSRGVRKPPVRSTVVIEDNADAAEMLAGLLALDGHQVQVAKDGRSGLEIVRRVRPDIVFCDIGLPDMSGYDVARALRGDESLRRTRLVALSGYVQPEDRERSREAGFDVHLAKPPDIEAICAVLAGDG